jgi:hypothetical protein
MARQNGGGGRQAAAPAKREERKPPAHSIRIGRIRASLWENETDDGDKWFAATLTRSYKDGKGQWQTASSFGRDDLLTLALILEQAYLWIARQQGGATSGLGSENGQAEDGGEETPAF